MLALQSVAGCSPWVNLYKNLKQCCSTTHTKNTGKNQKQNHRISSNKVYLNMSKVIEIHTSAAAVIKKASIAVNIAASSPCNTPQHSMRNFLFVLNNAHTITEESMTHNLDQTR